MKLQKKTKFFILIGVVSVMTFGLFQNATFPPALVNDCSKSYGLSLVTHWDANNKMQMEGGTGQYLVNDTTTITPGYIYSNDFLPTTDNYIGSNFSVKQFKEDSVTQWAKEQCDWTGQDFRFWKPSTSFEGQAAIDEILNLAESRGFVLVISGLTLPKSMYTIFLPANWKAIGTKGRYPIIFNGFYDINSNLIKQEGPNLAKLIAKSAQLGGTGAIGVLWNGGGVYGTRTANQAALNDFQQIIDLVSQLGGDRHRILGFGSSRGGLTALQMASNPYPHNYTFKYVDSAVPPSYMGTIAGITSATYPGLIGASSATIGLEDGYTKSFIYPDHGNDLTGLTAAEATAKILTGESDLIRADELYSLGSSRFINALKTSGAKVHLELGSHDQIVPSFNYLKLYHQYKSTNIPVQLRVNYLAGHYVDVGARQLRLEDAMKVYTHNKPGNLFKNRQKDFFKVDQVSGGLVRIGNSRFPFTLEIPRYLSPEVGGQFVSTGEPGTEVEITTRCFTNTNRCFTNSNSYSTNTINRTINSWGHDIFEISDSSVEDTTCRIIKVRIKLPGDTSVWQNVSLNNRTYKIDPAGEPLAYCILAKHPTMSGSDYETYVKEFRSGRAIGVFTGVNYGIVE